MTAYYDIMTELQTLFTADIDVNTVTRGSLDDVALNKQTIYSLAHIMVNSSTLNGATLNFNMSVICMDVVDESKESTTDIFIGNDNEMDVLNTTLAVLVRVLEQFRRGTISESGYHLTGTPSFEPFWDRFEDKVAGWVATFNVTALTNMTICD